MSKKKAPPTPAEFSKELDAIAARERCNRLGIDLKHEREQSRQFLTTINELRSRIELLERLDRIVVTPPRWTTHIPGKGKLHHGIPALLLSDCHWDEVVRPEEVEGANKYNRDIAVMRLKRVLHNTILVLRDYFKGLTYDGFVLMLGGDMLAGALREEDKETNEDTVYGSLDFWSEQLAAFINGLHGEFGKIHVASVVGNHPRNSRKPRSKLRVRDNLDWLLSRVAARATHGDILWQIPESADTDIPIYNVIVKLTHGDQFKGGSGIAAEMSPLLLGQHRKIRRQMALHKPFDILALGHFHQYFMGKGIVLNGSLVGYDEFAYTSNFVPQRPTQALWITTPEQGATFAAPIFADDRKAEGW